MPTPTMRIRGCEELAGIGSRGEVAVADGGQRDDAEVERVDEAKPFDDRVKARAADDRDDDEERERDELTVVVQGPDGGSMPMTRSGIAPTPPDWAWAAPAERPAASRRSRLPLGVLARRLRRGGGRP